LCIVVIYNKAKVSHAFGKFTPGQSISVTEADSNDWCYVEEGGKIPVGFFVLNSESDKAPKPPVNQSDKAPKPPVDQSDKVPKPLVNQSSTNQKDKNSSKFVAVDYYQADVVGNYKDHKKRTTVKVTKPDASGWCRFENGDTIPGDCIKFTSTSKKRDIHSHDESKIEIINC
jgi:hypothetical protein